MGGEGAVTGPEKVFVCDGVSIAVGFGIDGLRSRWASRTVGFGGGGFDAEGALGALTGELDCERGFVAEGGCDADGRFDCDEFGDGGEGGGDEGR